MFCGRENVSACVIYLLALAPAVMISTREQEAAAASSASASLCGDSLISFPLRAPAQWHDGPVQPLSSGLPRAGGERKKGRLGRARGWRVGMIPAEETPVWPYRWEQSTESSLAGLSLIIWQGAPDAARAIRGADVIPCWAVASMLRSSVNISQDAEKWVQIIFHLDHLWLDGLFFRIFLVRGASIFQTLVHGKVP